MKQTSTCILALLLLVGCGPDSEEAENSENGTNAATSEGTCADGEFDALRPFNEYPGMPIYFEYPDGWTVSDLESDFAYEGAISRRTSTDFPGYIQLLYTVRKNPVPDPDAERQAFETQGRELLRTIDFGGEMVEVYSLPEVSPVALVDAAFVFPANDGFYYAEFNANAPPDECLEERRALRTAVLDSLAPVQ